jgi:hypothetical protein
MSTLRKLAKQHFRTGDKKIVQRLDELRLSMLGKISVKEVIEINDIDDLDRIGRFTVASTLFTQCSVKAKAYLCADEHSHVRATAANAKNLIVGA